MTDTEALKRLKTMNARKFADHYMLLWNPIWKRWECRKRFFNESGESCHEGWFGDTPEDAIAAAWEAWREGNAK
jgi:hypothetical protein